MIKPPMKPLQPVRLAAPVNLWAQIAAFFGRKPVQVAPFKYGDGTKWGDGHRWSK